MNLTDASNYEQVLLLVQQELKDNGLLNYVPDDSIVILSGKDRTIVPQFQNYLIKLFMPDTGHIIKTPKIGRYFRVDFVIVVELWIKSFSKTDSRLLSGNLSVNKGIWEFFQDVENTLEHNTLKNNLQPMAGSNIRQPSTIKSDERQIEGISFLWVGNQNIPYTRGSAYSITYDYAVYDHSVYS
jgi:hypothetical protein